MSSSPLRFVQVSGLQGVDAHVLPPALMDGVLWSSLLWLVLDTDFETIDSTHEKPRSDYSSETE